MLNHITCKHFGPLTDLNWPDLGPINLVIGENGRGKTFLLKAIYSAIRTLEEYKRGNEPRSASEILTQKLHWTFQPDKIGDLVTKGEDKLSFHFQFDHHNFMYNFGKDTIRQISTLENHVPPRTSNSIFLPAKEVLSLHHIILKSREQDKVFGFDDTYLDLARALRIAPKKGKKVTEFSESRKTLEEMLGGRVEYDEITGRWQFKKGNQKFPTGVMAEGVKKIAILDRLLCNRYLDTSSVVLMDEPESALHPTAISKLLDIVALLAKRGIQFFLASHSYFVVKKLYLIAQKEHLSIPVLSMQNGQWTSSDLVNGMPDNSIIDESIRLYNDEMDLVLA